VKAALPKVRVPPAAAPLLKTLAAEARRRGLALYAVGGPVRDWLLGRKTFDIDLCVAGDPDPIADLAAKKLGGKSEPFGRFGTRRVIGRGRYRVDVATTRIEVYTQSAALPTVTATGVPVEEDLRRRDFTINAMALRLDDGSGQLIDPHGGLGDLKARTLRVLHDASFRDDPTRVFRAARYVARLRFKPSPFLGQEARDVLKIGDAAKLSRQRLLHELLALLGEEDPTLAFGLLDTWGYLELFHPHFPWRQKWPKGESERLASIALALGPEQGRAFVDGLPFEHRLRSSLVEALELAFSGESPRTEPSRFAAAAVRAASGKMSAAALKACFLSGADLIKAGLKPGPEFHEILGEAAKLQRLGRLKTRAAARSWLARR
jgi:tRNA nucleotidyltransferase (CCA-adding enzyme)